MLRNNTQFHSAIAGLTKAIQATTTAVVPLAKLIPHLRHWWNQELLVLKKKLNRLNNQSYKLRALADHPVHVEHREACNRYNDVIRCAKTEHWQEFLEGAQGPNIWTANWYIANPLSNGGQQCIPTLKVPWPDDVTAKATTNEAKAAVFSQSFFPQKPTMMSLPDEPNYPPWVKYKFRLMESRLCHQISWLHPHKALGDDSIPNVVLKEVVDLILPYLIQIFRVVFRLNTYSNTWCTWSTIVLHKPGKARYDVPKAYCPIVLMNTVGKLLSAVVAEDMSFMHEKHQLLPDTHFRGRLGKNTSNAMHYLVNKVKGTWRWHKVATVLFLDIEGAFPNAVTERLLHNMCMRRLLEPYVHLIEQMLTNQHTRLRFDGFTSDLVAIDNGIVQGNPLSMLLYLFYNADLIASPKK